MWMLLVFQHHIAVRSTRRDERHDKPRTLSTFSSPSSRPSCFFCVGFSIPASARLLRNSLSLAHFLYGLGETNNTIDDDNNNGDDAVVTLPVMTYVLLVSFFALVLASCADLLDMLSLVHVINSASAYVTLILIITLLGNSVITQQRGGVVLSRSSSVSTLSESGYLGRLMML
jgi:hypothetical protein